MNTIRRLVRDYVAEALGVPVTDLEGPQEKPPKVTYNGNHYEDPLPPGEAPEGRPTLTSQEFASRTGISLSTVYQLVRKGDIKRVPHPGNRVLIPVTELDRYR